MTTENIIAFISIGFCIGVLFGLLIARHASKYVIDAWKEAAASWREAYLDLSKSVRFTK